MNKIGELIPTIFYDLIGRIIPGIFFCLFILLDSRFSFITEQQVVQNSSTLFFIVLAYLTGFMLDIISESILYIIDIVVACLTRDIPGEINKVWNLDVWKVVETDLENNDLITNMKKKIAEVALFRNLAFSWIILWVVQISILVDLNKYSKTMILVLFIFSYIRRKMVIQYVSKRILYIRGEIDKIDEYRLSKLNF